MTKEDKEFSIREYCTGDFGDLGNHIGTIKANSIEEAKLKFQQENNIKDSEIGFYGFSEIQQAKDLVKEAKRNVENNNGWIKIESEKDLPKIEMQDCFIMDKTLGVIVGRFTLSEKNIWLENATHYQPIEKPKPPIY